MPHVNYHEIEADTHFELGLKKGELFGKSLRAELKTETGRQRWRRRVVRAEPYLEASKSQFPHLIEELEGYATGADVALGDLWAWDLDDELENQEPEQCTTFITNNGFLLGHNEDWEADAIDDICVLKRTIGGNTTFELYYLHTLGGCALSMNSHGVVHAVNSLSHRDHSVGVPKEVVARWLADTDSPERAIASLANIKRASGFHHLLVAVDGTAWSVECSAKRHHADKLRAPFAHTNHFLADCMADLERNDDRGGSFERYKQACLRVQPYMSAADAQTLLGDTSAGKRKSIFNRRTIARAVIDVDHMTAHVWLAREPELGWVEYANLFG